MHSALRSHELERKITTLIENKTSYSANSSQLNVFETFKSCSRVGLTFNQPVVVSMVMGKKVMHLEEKPRFDFYPGESVILPANKDMLIDFPDACLSSPTQCIALELERKSIVETVGLFNQKTVIEYDENKWDFNQSGSHLNNDESLNQLMFRIVQTFTSKQGSKDILIDLMVKELIVRLIQSESRHAILNSTQELQTNNRIAFVVSFIKENLHHDLSIQQLAEKAYMSESHFFRVFRNTMGCTPTAFINQERIKKAKELINSSNKSIQVISDMIGFNNVSYFNRIFKKIVNQSPGKYRASQKNKFRA